MKANFPEQKVTDARRYVAALLESGKITVEDYSESMWILDSARLKAWVVNDVKIPPCDYIKAYARAIEIEFGYRGYRNTIY